MKFLARLFAEIIMIIFLVITATKIINSEHHHLTGGMLFIAICVVALALRATIQKEMIKDGANERRRLERAFVSAASEAGWPRLVTVHHDRKVISYYIRVPYQGPDGDFYFEFPLEEEQLVEPIQLADLLPPEDAEKFYSNENEKEVNTTDTAAEEE